MSEDLRDYELIRDFLAASCPVEGIYADFVNGSWIFYANRELTEEEADLVREFAARFIQAS